MRREDFKIEEFNLGHLEADQQQILRQLLENNTQSFSNRLATVGLCDSVPAPCPYSKFSHEMFTF